MDASRVELESLLAHGRFVRAVARELLGDEEAEDAVQETWVRALARPPRRRGVRAWLWTAVRNVALNMRRDRRRALAKLARAPGSPAAPRPEEILEREALRRQVVEAVLTLREPYRTTVLLRYFEDLPPRAVARRLDVPIETVKTRLQRARRMLRGVLEEAWGAERMGLAVGLASLAGLARGRDGGAAITGSALASPKAKWIGAVVLVAGVPLVLWHGDHWLRATSRQPPARRPLDARVSAWRLGAGRSKPDPGSASQPSTPPPARSPAWRSSRPIRPRMRACGTRSRDQRRLRRSHRSEAAPTDASTGASPFVARMPRRCS